MEETQYQRIKRLRTESKYTQEYIGDYLGIQRAAVSKIEKGIVSIRPEHIRKLSNLYNVSIDYLMCNENKISNEYDLNYSWFNNTKWDEWNEDYDPEADFDNEILVSCKSLINSLLKKLSTLSQKEKYIVWNTILILNSNMKYNFELTSQLNSFHLEGLSILDKDSLIKYHNEIYKLYELYDELYDDYIRKKIIHEKNSSQHQYLDAFKRENILMYIAKLMDWNSKLFEFKSLIIENNENPENIINDYNFYIDNISKELSVAIENSLKKYLSFEDNTFELYRATSIDQLLSAIDKSIYVLNYIVSSVNTKIKNEVDDEDSKFNDKMNELSNSINL